MDLEGLPNALLTSLTLAFVILALVAWLVGVASLVRLFRTRLSQFEPGARASPESFGQRRMARSRAIKSAVIFIFALAAAGVVAAIKHFVLQP